MRLASNWKEHLGEVSISCSQPISIDENTTTDADWLRADDG